MACVDILKTATRGTLIFYDIDRPVGPNCANDRPDVLLVQFLMKDAMRTRHFVGNPSPGGPVTPTGVMDAPTIAGIRHFQTVLRGVSPTVSIIDGRVDPVPGTNARSTISNTQYTIVNLNMAFKTMRPTDYPNLANLADCPPDLRSVLQIQFIQAA
jgi:hypothetical protein